MTSRALMPGESGLPVTSAAAPGLKKMLVVIDHRRLRGKRYRKHQREDKGRAEPGSHRSLLNAVNQMGAPPNACAQPRASSHVGCSALLRVISPRQETFICPMSTDAHHRGRPKNKR